MKNVEPSGRLFQVQTTLEPAAARAISRRTRFEGEATRRRRMNKDDQRMCEAWGREKARMNRMSQVRGRGVVVLLANAEGRRPAWRACGEIFPLVLSPHAKKTRLAHRGGLLSVVRCLLITTKTRPRKPPLALAGVGTREERAP